MHILLTCVACGGAFRIFLDERRGRRRSDRLSKLGPTLEYITISMGLCRVCETSRLFNKYACCRKRSTNSSFINFSLPALHSISIPLKLLELSFSCCWLNSSGGDGSSAFHPLCHLYKYSPSILRINFESIPFRGK